MGSTSWQVKQKWKDKHYKRIAVDIRAELVEAFDIKVKENNTSRTAVIKKAIEDYIAE